MKLFSNKNTVQKIQAEDNKKDNQNTNFGLASMVVGLVSVVLSCLYAGFLGIIGFILGIVSLIKEEPKKGKAITGIVCSTVAFFISICILVGSSMDLSGYTENKEEQATAEISKEPGKTEKPAETKEPEPSTEPTAEPTLSPEETEEPEGTIEPAETKEPEKPENHELIYNMENIKASLTRYSYEENPYYLESLKEYIQKINELYKTMNTDQNASILSLEDILKDIGMSFKMRKKILNTEGKNVLTDEDFWRMDEKEDKSLFFSKGNYLEVSSKAKDDINVFNILSTFFYFGDLKDNKPDGEGVIFSVADTGMRILCAGEFEDGRLNGKGVIFSKDSLGAVIAEQGNYKNNNKNGNCTSYNNYDILQMYEFYTDTWNRYKKKYYKSYTKDKKNAIIENLLKKDIIAKLMYMSQAYNAQDKDSLFLVRVNYPVIKSAVSYKGNYKKGDYSGKGTLYGNSGTLWYNGEFKNGLYHGKGTLYYAFTGIVNYEGEFRNGNMDGEGILYNMDGSLRKKGDFDNEAIDSEDEMLETIGLYDRLYKKYQEVGLKKFFERNNTTRDDKTNKKNKSDKEYICPKSDVEKLSVEDIKKLSKADRRLAKNEIYARYGRKFNDENLQEYFNGKSWYTGNIEPEDFDEGVFSKVEKYNIKLLAKYE